MFRTLIVALFVAVPAIAQEVRVNVTDDASLRRALAGAKPGSRIVVAPGKYRAGLEITGVRGSADKRLVIEAADPKDKPVIDGGRLGIHVHGCAYVTLRNLVVRGASGNGINVDDGGSADTPGQFITIESVDVADIGPRGNTDAIKLSGVDDSIVRDCTIAGWGGEGIDMVGCHRVLIENCTFRGKPGFGQTCAVQAKGGSTDVTIRTCAFVNAAQRGVNLGGSTGAAYYRPKDANYEAKNVLVEGCRFTGSLAPICFVGIDGSTVRYNTFDRPEKWVVRILQETRTPGFVPSRNGRFEQNLIVADSRTMR
ncbi:MAG: nitrous oxide reductase family maturation protein NosD, partial [Phycisphaerae bacterium]